MENRKDRDYRTRCVRYPFRQPIGRRKLALLGRQSRTSGSLPSGEMQKIPVPKGGRAMVNRMDRDYRTRCVRHPFRQPIGRRKLTLLGRQSRTSGSLPSGEKQKIPVPKGRGSFGAANRDRTGTVLPPRDFKSLASASSAIAAKKLLIHFSIFKVPCQGTDAV